VIATASGASAVGWAAIALAIGVLAGMLVHVLVVHRLRSYGEARTLDVANGRRGVGKLVVPEPRTS
jgi:hypothetical protein